MKNYSQSLKKEIKHFPYSGLSVVDIALALEPTAKFAIWESSNSQLNNGLFATHTEAKFSYIAIFVEEEFYSSSPSAWTDFTNLYTTLTSEYSFESEVDSHLPTFQGGFIGYVAYDTARFFENIIGLNGNNSVPDIYLIPTKTLLVIDREKQLITVFHYPGLSLKDNFVLEDESSYNNNFWEKIDRLLDKAREISHRRQKNENETERKIVDYSELISKEEFIKITTRAKDYICAGDIFQVVLANTFIIHSQLAPIDLYQALKAINLSPYHFLLKGQFGALVGASPEVMLKSRRIKNHNDVYKTEIAMRLVAGTFDKGASIEQHRQRAAELKVNSKELAEHLMLVDHARNDIGRVSEIGSVVVSDLFSVETYADVHHLVSQVSATLPENTNVLSALRSCFPIATLTGTPKIRAMEIIAELEGESRGIFGGAVFTLGFDGMIDSAVVIRSAVFSQNKITIQAGAGIVYNSDPESEYLECHLKAKALLNAISRCPVT